MEKIKVKGLRKYFRVGKKVIKAVDEVDLSIREGEICALIGESGSGKSTLAKLILRLIEPEQGEIFYNGINITKLNQRQIREFRKKTQMIFQDPFATFNPVYKVGKQIFEAIKFRKVVESSVIEDYLIKLMENLSLHSDLLWKYPSQLSGGQLQRFAIVRAISLRPEFLICDEITSALDVATQVQAIEFLRNLRNDLNLTVLLITHDISVAIKTADKIFVMRSGKIIESGTVDKILQEPEREYTKKLIYSAIGAFV